MPKSRGTRWYRKNEEEVMDALGLSPTKNSGAGWVEKEDGQNDHLIAQLKSTDAGSMSIKHRDIEILEANAQVAHKVPLFVIQFIQSGDVFIMARPTDMEKVVEYINTGACQRPTDEFNIKAHKKHKVEEQKVIRSSSEARDGFWDDKGKEAEQWQKRKRKSRLK